MVCAAAFRVFKHHFFRQSIAVCSTNADQPLRHDANSALANFFWTVNA
jgi:hypothetical protein